MVKKWRKCEWCGVFLLFFYLYYDLGPVVVRLRFAAPRQEPWDDKVNKKPPGWGGMVVLLFLSCLVIVAQAGDFAS